MADINLGDNWGVDEDSNGDYVVTYRPTDTVIERIDSDNQEKLIEVGTQISSLTDASSGATVYDSATETLGDGTQSGDLQSLDTDDAAITGHAYVEGSLASDKTGLTAQNWTNTIDTEDEDNNGDFNSSNQFVAPETAKYHVIGKSQLDPGKDGDLMQLRWANVTDSTAIEIDEQEAGGSSANNSVSGSLVTTLNEGDSYELQARDNDNSYTIKSASNSTYLVVYKIPVQP